MRSRNESRIFTLIVLAGLLLVPAALIYVMLLHDSPDELSLPLEEGTGDAPPGLDSGKEPPEPDVPQGEARAGPLDERSKTGIPGGEPVPPGVHCFHGMVVDEWNQEPVPDFSAVVHRKPEGSEEASWKAVGDTESFEGTGGYFSLFRPVESGWVYRVSAGSKGYNEGASRELAGLSSGAGTQVYITLRPIGIVTGKVMDAATMKPVRGALVYSATDAGPDFGFDDDVRDTVHAETDGDGGFALNVETRGSHLLVARHAGYAEAVRAEVVPGIAARILLRPGCRIEGKALDPKGRPAVARVLVIGYRGRGLPVLEHRVETGWGGAFATRLLHPGIYWVRIEEIPGYPKTNNRFGAERVILNDRDVIGVETGGLPGRGTLIGTLLCDRQPVAGMEVSAARRTPSPFLVPETDLSDPSNSLALPGYQEAIGYNLRSRRAERPEPPAPEEILLVTDPEGRFGLHAMKPGEYRLYFILPGGERFSPEDFRVVLEPDSFAESAFCLSEGSIEGTLVDHASMEPLKKEGSRVHLFAYHGGEAIFLRSTEADGEGRFMFSYVPEGAYACIASAKGYGPAEEAFTFDGIGKKTLEMVLRPGGPVLARLETNGRPPSPGEIEFRIHGRYAWLSLPGHELARNREGGYIIDRMPEKKTWLQCRCWGMVEKELVGASERETASVTFRFSAAKRVRGRVLAAAWPVENARVSLSDSMSVRPPFFIPGNQVYSTRTDCDGHFTLTVPEGREYLLALYSAADFRLPVLAPAGSIGHKTSSVLEIITGEYPLEGILVDGDSDEPLPDVEVILQDPHGESMSLSARDGRFVFFNLSGGKSVMYVQARGYAPQRVRDIEPPFPRLPDELTIPLGKQGARLKLFLPEKWSLSYPEASTGELSIGMDRYLFHHAEHSFRRSVLSLYLGQCSSEEDGSFLIRGLRPGEKKIQARCSMGRRSYTSGGTAELKEGETVELHLK